jgi:tetratricopeptide (TPR) repeat protein
VSVESLKPPSRREPDAAAAFGKAAEAIWLTALVALPVFFNPWSQRGFEPVKAALLCLAGILLFCVLLWRGTTRGEVAHALRSPILLGVSAFALSQLVSSLLSVAPSVAFLGSYDRSQGLVMVGACIILFLAVALWARGPNPGERLFRVIVFSSIPVCVYAIVQRLGLDPVPWSDDVTWRSSSTIGNPVFLGAYLIMLLPVTTCQIIRARGFGFPAKVGKNIPVFVYGGALWLQLAALWLSGSRGPFLGGMVGMFMFVVLALLSRGNRRWAMGLIAAGTLFALWLLAQQICRPAGHIHNDSARRKFPRVLDLEESAGRVRMATWSAMARLVLTHDLPAHPDGTRDRWSPLRLLIGYGPECLPWVFDPVYPAELGRLEDKSALPDRAHNETWDVLAATGLIGLAAVWLLYLAIIHTSLRRLALVRHRHDTLVLTGCCLGGGLVGAVLAGAWRGLPLVGLGGPFGIAGGLLLYLGLSARRPAPTPIPSPASSGGLMIAALLSGVMAHLVEIQLGFATILSQTLFWTYAAMLLAAGSREAPPLAHGWRTPGFRVALSMLAAAAILLICLRPLVADMLVTRGLNSQREQNQERAIEYFEQAARLAPLEETYRSLLGKIRFLQALSPGPAAARQSQMEQAVRDLLRAQALNPLRSENAVNLGGAYTGWAALSESPQLRRERGRLADAFYAQALQISPNHVNTWNERALLHLNVLQSPERAESYLQHALDLDMNEPRTHELLGSYHERMGYSATNQQERVHHLGLAVEHYEWRMELAKEGYATAIPFDLYLRTASLCRDLKNMDDQGLWEPHPQIRGLPAVSDQTIFRRLSYGQYAERYAAEALRLAPEKEKEKVRTFRK